MSARKKKIDYTLRGVPPEMDARIRETAATEGVSLNAALLDLVNRGLRAAGDSPKPRRDLSSLVADLPERSAEDERFMRRLLAEMDVVDEEMWK